MLLAWLVVLSWWTSGFTAFTTYSHTLREAGALPRAAPSFRIRDQFGVLRDTSEFRGRYVLLQFSYLSCGDVCPLAMADFHRLYSALRERTPAELVLLTVSFDPARDTTERLFDVWRHHGRPAGWTMASLASPLDEAIQADLRRLGAWVSRRDDSDFNHTAQAFLLDPEGQVVRVLDRPVKSEAMLAMLRENRL
jgi:protein SCO1/2